MAATSPIITTEGKPMFECKTCTRCGGSGRWSYCQTMTGKYGPHTCFKCIGTGSQLTPRGARQQEYYNSRLTKSVSEIKVGDTIRWHNGKFYKVTEIRPGNVDTDGGYVVDGKTIAHPWVVKTTACTYHCFADATFRVGFSEEAKAAIRAEAFQVK